MGGPNSEAAFTGMVAEFLKLGDKVHGCSVGVYVCDGQSSRQQF